MKDKQGDFYPMSKDELKLFIDVILALINKGEIDEVKRILEKYSSQS